ncbi:MAG: SUMF1/EgtB/PvdO family nonheme iron enzyme [Deltaproteobacteria bacterium]
MKLNKPVKFKRPEGLTCRRYIFAAAVICLLLTGSLSEGEEFLQPSGAKYVILMISDGWGIKHIEATGKYTGRAPAYQFWDPYWMSTYPAGGGYDPELAWSDFDYVKRGPTDSAASATAMYTGTKTKSSMLGVSLDGERLYSIAEKARMFNMAVGAVSTVQISHATPGAWYAHNDYRFNSYAIAEEGLFGDPHATYDEWDWNERARYLGQKVFKRVPRSRKVFKDLYTGDRGPSDPIDVLIGADGLGHSGESYLNDYIRGRLRNESSEPDKHTLIESVDGKDNGARLIRTAENENITKLVGLFGHSYRLADGSGRNLDNPTLAEMTTSALTVLARNPHGFVLLIEGGAVDYAGHDNDMNLMIGEQIDFDEAVQAVVDWVENPSNGSDWENTLVIVTGDHESGYLTAGPGVFPDQLLGEVSDRTISLEKEVDNSDCRASWEDGNENNTIDSGETVFWVWNTCRNSAHTNNLVPLYAKGLNSELFATFATKSDPVRGSYIDNTDVHKVMDTVLSPPVITDDTGTEMVLIPAGEFRMGCNKDEYSYCQDYENPLRLVHVDSYAIDKTEVTVAQYGECVKAGRCKSDNLNLPEFRGSERPELSFQCNWGKKGKESHPINCVDLSQAEAYCHWAGKRLPTEAEWEKAARGTDGRIYPWGNNDFNGKKALANLGDEEAKRNNPKLDTVKGYNDGFYTTSPVGSFPQGASPYGVLDLAGNVWEWTGDICDFEIKRSIKGRIKNFISRIISTGEEAMSNDYSREDSLCVRGGSWKNAPSRVRVYHRAKDIPNERFGNTGFRCAR